MSIGICAVRERIQKINRYGMGEMRRMFDFGQSQDGACIKKVINLKTACRADKQYARR